jgi:4-hydroxy-tetrahydrodipicolinate reductase
MTLSIGIIGITGKMGRAISSIILGDPKTTLSGGTTHKNSIYYGHIISSFLTQYNGEKHVSDDIERLLTTSDVVIDFSHPSILDEVLTLSTSIKTPLIIGTTGLTPDNFKHLDISSKHCPILYSSNFSIGIALINKFIKTLPSHFIALSDISILEKHHKEKKDSPSGTALTLSSNLKRTDSNKAIPIQSIRQGKEIGLHSILFDSEYEDITINHMAKTRKVFAKGAVIASKFIHGKGPGLYTIEDVLL